MSKHTVAVMGLGVRGKIHIHGLLGNPDDFEITCGGDVKDCATGGVCVCHVSGYAAEYD